MIVVVNDQQMEVDERTTVASLLQLMGFPDRGVAVAMDSAVLRRSDWATRLTELGSVDEPVRLEVVTAVQGG